MPPWRGIGRPPSFTTEGRVLYDRSALYVSIRAHDPDPTRIVGLLTRRDTDSPSDWLGVIVDSYHDRRTAYEFNVNAAGVKIDQAVYNDGCAKCHLDDLSGGATSPASSSRFSGCVPSGGRSPACPLESVFGAFIVSQIVPILSMTGC